MKSLMLAAAMLGVFSTAALGDDRYAKRPPVVLSPDLAAPWIMQLGGKVRPVVYRQPVTAEEIALAQEGMNGCPTDSIGCDGDAT